ncbi:MAG: hypothetical protein IPF74_17255 [Rhodocyclaceae bacterium]|nr:hypothetical protein [Rhodocyclaceae bacterium]
MKWLASLIIPVLFVARPLPMLALAVVAIVAGVISAARGHGVDSGAFHDLLPESGKRDIGFVDFYVSRVRGGEPARVVVMSLAACTDVSQWAGFRRFDIAGQRGGT